MITVEKIDETFVRVTSESFIEQELAQHFTFEVPGAKFMPAVKARRWDGKMRLYSTQTKKIYTGLCGYLQQFASDRGYDITFNTGYVQEEFDPSYIDDLGLPYQVRDYQLEGIKKCIEKRRALIISPTGSGKSLIIYTTISNYPGKKLIIVPTTSLVYQMKSDFESYNYKPDIQIIMSGQEKVNRENVVISTWQSIYKMKKDWFNQFEVIIGDEAHLFKAKSLTSIMSKASEVPYKFGFTGTLDDALTHRLVLEGLFGPVYKVTTTAELMHKQLLATLNIRALVLNYTQQTRVNNCRYAYQDEIRFLTGCEARTKFIANLAISKNTNTLVLFNIIDHGQSIYDHIKALVDTSVEIDRKVFFVYGGVNASEREEIRTIVEQETNAIIVASYGTFSTGINIKNLHNIVFASPSKSKIRVLQSIGRGLRVSDGSNVTTLYDIADNFEYKNKANYVLKHFIERVRFYTDEKFNYKIFPVDIGV